MVYSIFIIQYIIGFNEFSFDKKFSFKTSNLQRNNQQQQSTRAFNNK